MKHSIASLFTTLVLASIAATSAIGATDHAGHAGHAGQGDAARPLAIAQAGTAMADGEVRKIDKGQGKITLKHGEIKNLDMPPMTMVFKVKDAALLERVQQGDRVGFTAEKIGGEYTVTGIEARK